MGKASRRQRRTDSTSAARPAQAPFVARPFEGLADETEWVALREILPAAMATVQVRPEFASAAEESRIVTVLPLAWPGLRRADGVILASTQSGHASGDASRDLAAQLLAVAALEPGSPLVQAPQITADTPRLQDILVPAPLTVEVKEGFDFWVEGQELGEAEAESLQRANESAVPTTRLAALPSTYHVVIGERSFIRVVLPQDEDAATDALARLAAAGTAALHDDTRLLGAFRACGLLIAVWEVDTDAEPTSHEDGLTAFGTRYAAALADDTPLTPEQRRARSGLLSRQVTLR